jgi:hypothetical protein
MYASGAAEVLEKFMRDRDDADGMAVGLGSSPELDELFFSNLRFHEMIQSF